MITIVCVGLAVRDIVFSVPSLPEGPGKNPATKRTEVGGGPAATAAVTIAALGGEARFVGPVGDDQTGTDLVDELRSDGVDTTQIRIVAGASSPMSVVTIDKNGERAIVNHSDPKLFEDAEPIGDSDLVGADAVLADIKWPRGAEDALKWAREMDLPGVLDFDAGSISEVILDTPSHIVFSSDALWGLTGNRDPVSGIREVADRCPAWVAVTAGPDGTYWIEGDSVAHHPGFEIDAVDTLGAGDVFHGAFAMCMAADQSDIHGAIRFASAAAAISCTRFGGRAGIPTSAELRAFLEEHP